MNPRAIHLAGVLYWYYIAKFTEFFDTFFFVLRKKSNNVSFLHVLHHGVMPFFSWYSVKYSAGGSVTKEYKKKIKQDDGVSNKFGRKSTNLCFSNQDALFK
ncbi:uncharacterized protein CBL_09970 [Carabus blaptoides fortunei]